MNSESKKLRVFASSREEKMEDAPPFLMPMFLEFPGETHTKAQSREEEEGGERK